MYRTNNENKVKPDTAPTDATDGQLCDVLHAKLAAVQRASSALLTELELGKCVGAAASECGSKLRKPLSDPRVNAAKAKRNSTVAVSTAARDVGYFPV